MTDFYNEKHKCFRYRFVLTTEQCHDGMILLDEPNVCRCEIRKIGNNPNLANFELKNNYAARIPCADDLAIEAVIYIHSEQHPQWDHQRIGIPLSEIPGVCHFELVYNGINFDLFGDGLLLDEERVFGEPVGIPSASYTPEPSNALKPEIFTKKMQNWSPESLNAWVGDVSVGFFNEKFYIFYLSDRRHHASKFAQGGHTWGLLRTSDFKTWEHVPDILPLEGQWQTYGTGTPFEWENKIYLTHGLHTSRFYTDHSHPEGATWAESTDGIHFTPSREIFGKAENPSIYNLDGKLYIFQGYCSDRLNIKTAVKWHDFNQTINLGVLCGDKTPTHHSIECPAYFQWKNKHYLLIGFTGMYSSDTVDFKHPVDLAAQGDSVYDGLGVPMVAAYKNDRRILVGWLWVDGWGGVLGLRELVYFPDGILGCRWLEEIMPVFSDYKSFRNETDISGNDFILDLQVKSNNNLCIHFTGKGEPVVFRINAKEKKAELFFSSDQKGLTLAETGKSFSRKNIAVTNLREIDKPYRVRILGTYSRKLNGTVLDVEIAEVRTLIHHFTQHVTQKVTIDGDLAEAKYSCRRIE